MAVDVTDLECAGFTHTHAGGVDGLQQGALAGACAGGKQACDLLARQQLRLFDRGLGEDNLEVFAWVAEHDLE